MFMIFVALGRGTCTYCGTRVVGVVHEVRGSGRVVSRDIPKDRGCREDDFTVRNEGAFVLRLETGNSTIATKL